MVVRPGYDQRVVEPGPRRSRPTPPGGGRIIARTWFGKALGLLVPMIRDLPGNVLLSTAEPTICSATVRAPLKPAVTRDISRVLYSPKWPGCSSLSARVDRPPP